jgi:lipopolysaccharide cholinephosphotransferase
MKEYERIIKEGILPPSFFKAETICDYFVSEKTKRLWGVLFDMLVQFDRICRKYDLKYYVAFGSLLGAIRHHGFIPWDDDLDVCMPRKDFNKFLEVAASELKEPIYLQVPGKDKDYYMSCPRLRNSNTAAIPPAFRYCEFNQGLYLDIFVLDNILLDKAKENYDQVKNLILESTTNMRRSNPFPTEDDLKRRNMFPERDQTLVWDELEKTCTKFNSEKTDYAMVSNVTIAPWNKMVYKWSDIEDLVEVDLYGRSFFIPKNYDTLLKASYGNYMEFPPVEDRGQWHSTIIFDPDKSYKEYIKELRAKDVQN